MHGEFFPGPIHRICLVLVFILGTVCAANAASVWKVTGPNGGIVYLGGSIHGLESTDYPLPPAYNRAFDLSSRLVFEDDEKASPGKLKNFVKTWEYPKNDNLKNHIDPRVYDYLRRVFALAHVPEKQFSKLRPWALVLAFVSGGTNSLGVESYLGQRAHRNHKPIEGLESFHEHTKIISGLDDHQAQLVLLAGFIPQATGTDKRKFIVSEWRAGHVDAIARDMRNDYKDLPSFYQRLIVNRNRNWIPKIERYMQKRDPSFIVAGAGHMGGPDGVLALLKARGCKIEEM